MHHLNTSILYQKSTVSKAITEHLNYILFNDYKAQIPTNSSSFRWKFNYLVFSIIVTVTLQPGKMCNRHHPAKLHQTSIFRISGQTVSSAKLLWNCTGSLNGNVTRSPPNRLLSQSSSWFRSYISPSDINQACRIRLTRHANHANHVINWSYKQLYTFLQLRSAQDLRDQELANQLPSSAARVTTTS